MRKFLLAILLLTTSAFGQTSYFSDRAVGVSPFGHIVGLVPIQNGQVRVCNLPLTQTSPCLPLAPITGVSGFPISTSGSNFGQVTTNTTGQFSFGCVTGNLRIQIAPQSSNTPQLEYNATCPTGQSAIPNVLFSSRFASPQLTSACNALGSNEGTVIVSSLIDVTDDFTAPSNCGIVVFNGGGFNISPTKTLTLGGALEAGPYKIVYGTGSLNFTATNPKNVQGYVEWWGATKDDNSDASPAINSAFGSGVKHIKFLAGEYAIGSALLISKDQLYITGDRTSTIIVPLTTSFPGTNYIMDVTTPNNGGLNMVIDGIRFRGFTVAGQWTGGGFRAGNAGTNGFLGSIMRYCWFDLGSSSGDAINVTASFSDFEHNTFELSGGGLHMTFGSAVSILHTKMQLNAHNGIFLDGGATKTIGSVQRAANVVTVGITGHGYPVDALVTIRGVTSDITLNGTFRISTIAANSFTYASSGADSGPFVEGTTTVPDIIGVTIDDLQVEEFIGSTAQGADSVVTGTGVDNVTVSNVWFEGQQTAILAVQLPNLVRFENSTNIVLHNLSAFDSLIGSSLHIDALAHIVSSQVRADTLNSFQTNYLLSIEGADNDISITHSQTNRSQAAAIATSANATGRIDVSDSTFLHDTDRVILGANTGTFDFSVRNNTVIDPVFNGNNASYAFQPDNGGSSSAFVFTGNALIRTAANSWTGYWVDARGDTGEQIYNENIFPTTGNNIQTDGGTSNQRFGCNIGLNGSAEWDCRGTGVDYNAAGTQSTEVFTVRGTCTLGTDCVVTLIKPFTNTNYVCAASDATSANAVKIVNTAAGTVTITGTGTDVINYVCRGN